MRATLGSPGIFVPARTLRKLQTVLAITASAFCATTSQAQVIAQEAFDYANGATLGGLNGGTGFAGAWSTPSTGTRVIQSPGFFYPNLLTTGNRAFISAANQNQRTLSAGVLGTGDETIWISFIGQRVGANNVRFFGMSFYQGTTASANERFTIGENSSNANDLWGAHFTSTAQGRVEAAGASVNTMSLLLVRLDYHAAANDDLYLWVNPNLSLGEPGIGTAHASNVGNFNLAFDILSIRGGTLSGGNIGEALYDEIRVGNTFGDVTPIPEPSTFALAGLGILLVAGRHRFRA